MLGFCKNNYKISKDGKIIIGLLSGGTEFKFDAEDFNKVNKYTWYPSIQGSNQKSCINRDGTHLHRYIMNAPEGYEVDHINWDRMNNCKNNLRICTHQQNQCNHGIQSNNTSGVTGVRFYKARNKYIARIKYFGKDIHLGYYLKKFEAIQARDTAAKLLFGEFAVLNDVPEAPKSIKNYVYEKCEKYLEKSKVS